MSSSASSPTPAWELHVHPHLGSVGTLVLAGSVPCMVHLTPALTSLLVALVACRAIDERAGLSVKVGYRTRGELGKVVARMPGPGNPISSAAVGGYKRRIVRLVRNALAELPPGLADELPMPILQPGYGQGYCLPPEGIRLHGVALDALEAAAHAVEQASPPLPGAPHRGVWPSLMDEGS